MAGYFLDTSFLVDLINVHPSAVPVHEDIAGEEVTGTVCAYELSKVTAADLATVLAGKEVVPLTVADAIEAGAVFRELSDGGTPIGETDTLIAGTARRRGLTLVTRDEHFRRVPDLETRYY